jgi:uncharacterized protein YaiI (UPF0178 family)
MHPYIDADACPRPIKDIIYRAAERRRLHTTFVANSPLKLPPSDYLHFLQVEKGFDVADQKIVDLIQPGDLVITADIPLAAAVVEKEAYALNPRGDFYTEDNFREKYHHRYIYF